MYFVVPIRSIGIYFVFITWYLAVIDRGHKKGTFDGKEHLPRTVIKIQSKKIAVVRGGSKLFRVVRGKQIIS